MIDFFDIQNSVDLSNLCFELRSLGYKEDHSAFTSGYVSRKISARITPYKGRFGEGVLLHIPCYCSTRYHLVIYYILEV